MQRTLTLALLCTLFVCGTSSAGKLESVLQQASSEAEQGNTAAAMATLRSAMMEVSSQSPISVTNATLVENQASGFGIYQPRGNNVFKAGEPILIYAEPVGYRFVKKGDHYDFGFSADFAVLSEKQEVLGGQRNFQQWSFSSTQPLFEVFVNLTYNLTGAPPGKYFIETTFTDANGGGQVSFQVPVVME